MRANFDTECLLNPTLNSSLIGAHPISFEALKHPLHTFQGDKQESHAYQSEIFDTAETSYSDDDIIILFGFQKELLGFQFVHSELCLN